MSQKMSAEVLCRVDAHGLGIKSVVPDQIMQRMLSWQAGVRSHLGARSRGQLRIAGPKAAPQIRYRARSAAPTAALPQAPQRWAWQEGQAPAWQRSEPTEEETIDWGGGGRDLVEDEDEDEEEEEVPDEVVPPWRERYGHGQPSRPYWEDPAWQARATVTLTPRPSPYQSWSSYSEWQPR